VRFWRDQPRAAFAEGEQASAALGGAHDEPHDAQDHDPWNVGQQQAHQAGLGRLHVEVRHVLAQQNDELLILGRHEDEKASLALVLVLAFDAVVHELDLRNLLGRWVLLDHPVEVAVRQLPVHLLGVKRQHPHQRDGGQDAEHRHHPARARLRTRRWCWSC
jgi:hypothetical protein